MCYGSSAATSRQARSEASDQLVLSLTLPQPVNRVVNIVAAIGFFGFNLIGLPTYPSAYDKFLIAASLVFNALTVWYAWNWE